MVGAETPHARLGNRWAILAAVFVLQMLALGCTTYSFGLFVKPIAAEFSISRATVNLGLMFLLSGTALASPFVGSALDRFPARLTILAGSAAFTVGGAVIVTTDQLWLMAVALVGPIAMGIVSFGPLSTSLIVTRWFAEAPTRPLAVAGISGSAGGVLVVPCMSFIVAHEGWRSAVLAAACLSGLSGSVVALWIVRDRPAPTALAQGIVRNNGWTVARLFSNRDFWLLLLTVGVLMAISGALVAALVAYGTDRGFTLAQATSLVSGISASSIVSKTLISVLGDFCDRRTLLAVSSIMLGIFLFLLTSNPSFSVLLAGCLLTGVATGATLPIWSSTILTRFGPQSYGFVMGLMLQIQLPLMLFALSISGTSYDATGSYIKAFQYFMAAIPVVAVGCLLIGRPGFQKL